MLVRFLLGFDVSIPSPVFGRCMPFGTSVDVPMFVAAKRVTTTQQPHRKMS